jgi:hypothetical protein
VGDATALMVPWEEEELYCVLMKAFSVQEAESLRDEACDGALDGLLWLVKPTPLAIVEAGLDTAPLAASGVSEPQLFIITTFTPQLLPYTTSVGSLQLCLFQVKSWSRVALLDGPKGGL